MKGATSALNVDGSAKIYANSVRLVDVVIDVDGNGGNTDGTTASVFYVEATTGNIELAGTIRANADTDTALNQNDVTLVSTAGNIVNNSGSVIAIDQVNSLTLTANGSIGTSTAPVTVNAKEVTLTSNATTGTPNIYIENNPKVLNNDSGSSQVTLGAVTTGTLLGNISYKQTGQNLLVSGGVTSNGGSILIDPPVDVTVASDIDAGGGNITLQASNDISFTTGDLITSGTGTILVQADSDSDGAGNLTFTNAGTVGAEKIRVGAGTIQLRGEHISLNDFSAITTGKIDILAGQGGASTGEVFSGAVANALPDLSAATFDIEAKGAGIGQSGGNTIEIVASGQVDAEADGPIHITSVVGNALSVGLIDAGSNTVTLVGNNGVIDTGNDAATDIIGTTLTINDGAAGSAGTITLDTAAATLDLIGGDVTIHDGDGIDIAAITATSLDLLTNGGITDSGAVSVTGLAQFNSTGSSIVLGDATTANFGSLDFSGSAVTIFEASAMEIAASEATGALNLTASGAITQAGVIDAISTSFFNAGAGTITLTQANDFAGAVSLISTGTNLVEVTDANAINLGTVNVGGALKVTSSGTITDTGNLTVVGLATLVSGGNAITLGDGTTANFGSVDFAGSTVTITEGSDMMIAESEATGALSLTASGKIEQNGRLDADNTTKLDNNSNAANITLLHTDNDFSGAVSIESTNVVSVVLLNDVNSIDLGTLNIANDFTLTSNGTISDSGNIEVGDLANFTSGANPITLGDGTTADFGSLDFDGSLVTISEDSSMAIVAGKATGALVLSANGAITQTTGIIDADLTASLSSGANVITLDSANDFTGALSVSNTGANDVSINDVNALGLGTASVGQNLTVTSGGALDLGTVSVGNDLTVTSGGDLKDSGLITVPGLAKFVATDQVVTLGDTTAANFGTLEFTGGAVTITEDSSMAIVAGKATGALVLSANGAITQTLTGAIDADAASSFTAGANAITLTQATNDFTGSVSLTGGVTSLKDANDLTVSLTTSGTAALTAVNSLTVNGTVSGATGDLTTAAAATSFGATTVSRNLSVTASGAVSDTDKLAVAGTTTISATGQTVELDTATNDFTGAVTITGGATILKDATDLTVSLVTSGTTAITAVSNLTLDGTVSGATSDLSTTAAATSFGTTAVGQNLSTTASGNISQTGALDVEGTSSFTTQTNDTTITLTNVANEFTGAVSLISTDSDSNNEEAVQLTNSIATVLGGSTESGSLVVVSKTGNISQTGSLDVDTTSSFTTETDDADITLGHTSNDLTGAISLVSTDTNADNTEIVQLTNNTTGGTILAGSTETGSLSVTSILGNISQTGALNVGSTSSFSTSADDGDITLTHASNALVGAISLVSTDTNADNTEVVQLINNTTGGTILGGSTETGTLSVTSTFGSITQTGALNIGSTASFTTSADDADITLNEAANALAGAITLISTDTDADDEEGVAITNSIATVLGGSTQSGALSVTSANGNITQTGSLDVDGITTISAATNSITLDNTANDFTGVVNVTGMATTIKDANDIDLGEVSISTLDLVAGGSVTDAVTVSGVKVTGITKVSAGTNIILNSPSNVFGDSTELNYSAFTAGNKVIIVEDDKVRANVVAKSLQVKGTTGIQLDDGSAITSLAASSDSGSIKLLNTGGLSIDDFSTDSDLALDGVELKSGTVEEGKISLQTKSPITVNAPITNSGEGQIILAALGKEATDDITINSSISGDDLKVYAGDSIILNSSAVIDIVDSGNNHAQSSDSSNNDLTGISNGNTQFFYGTDFTTGIVQQGVSSGNVIIQDSATLNTLVEVSNSVRTEYIFDGVSNRLTYGTPEQIQDTYNLSDPNLESLDIWSSLNYGNVIISNEYSEEEEDEDTKISISKIRD